MKNFCCCIGFRPDDFAFEYEKDEKRHKEYLIELEEKVKLAITKYGITNFISGMALGVDMDFVEIVLKFKDKYNLTLECAIPYPDHTLKWKKKDKLRYNEIINNADEVNLISEKYTSDCKLKRYRYMIDKSGLIICAMNSYLKGRTRNAVQYAMDKVKVIEFIYIP